MICLLAKFKTCSVIKGRKSEETNFSGLTGTGSQDRNKTFDKKNE